MAKFRKEGGKETPAISTASLPDIVFMLLFFFMVSTTMREVLVMVDNGMPEAKEISKLEKKSLVSNIFIGKPKDQYVATYGSEPRIQLNDKLANVSEISSFVAAEQETRKEEERNMITNNLKVDQFTKMGIVSGSNGKLNINDTMTRAEMATIFSKTCSYIDTAKEMLADKEQAKKDKEEADKNAEQEIQGNDYKKTTVTESKAYDGEDASFTNCTIDFASQKDSVLKMANGTLGVFGSTVKSYGYDAIVVSDNGRANVENSTVSASEANTLNIDSTSKVTLKDSTIKSDGKITTMFGAVVKGGTLELDKSTIATSKFSSVSLLGGSTFEMSNGSKLEVTDKGVTPIVIAGNEVSKGEVDDTNTNSTNINIDESTISTNKAPLLQLTDCVADVVISNSDITCDSVFDNVSNGVKQSKGSTLNITLKNQELTGDITPDYNTKVNLNIGSGSSYKGAIDVDSRQVVNVKLATDAKLTLTNTSYVDALELEDTAFNNLDLAGNILYYNMNNPLNDFLQGETHTLGSGELVPYGGPQ